MPLFIDWTFLLSQKHRYYLMFLIRKLNNDLSIRVVQSVKLPSSLPVGILAMPLTSRTAIDMGNLWVTTSIKWEPEFYLPHSVVKIKKGNLVKLHINISAVGLFLKFFLSFLWIYINYQKSLHLSLNSLQLFVNNHFRVHHCKILSR